MAEDPLAPQPKAPAAAGTPPAGPTGGSFEETIRSNKDLKPEQAEAILAAHKSETDRALNGLRQKWEKEELPARAQQLAEEVADRKIKANNAMNERTARNKEIVSEEFGIVMRGRDGQPTEGAKALGQKIAETCKKLGIDKDIALSTDEGVRGLLIACGYQSKAVPEKEEFGPASGLPSGMRREAAAASAVDPAKRTPWQQADIESTRAIQEAMASGLG